MLQIKAPREQNVRYILIALSPPRFTNPLSSVGAVPRRRNYSSLFLRGPFRSEISVPRADDIEMSFGGRSRNKADIIKRNIDVLSSEDVGALGFLAF